MTGALLRGLLAIVCFAGVLVDARPANAAPSQGATTSPSPACVGLLTISGLTADEKDAAYEQCAEPSAAPVLDAIELTAMSRRLSTGWQQAALKRAFDFEHDQVVAEATSKLNALFDRDAAACPQIWATLAQGKPAPSSAPARCKALLDAVDEIAGDELTLISVSAKYDDRPTCALEPKTATPTQKCNDAPRVFPVGPRGAHEFAGSPLWIGDGETVWFAVVRRHERFTIELRTDRADVPLFLEALERDQPRHRFNLTSGARVIAYTWLDLMVSPADAMTFVDGRSLRPGRQRVPLLRWCSDSEDRCQIEASPEMVHVFRPQQGARRPVLGFVRVLTEDDIAVAPPYGRVAADVSASRSVVLLDVTRLASCAAADTEGIWLGAKEVLEAHNPDGLEFRDFRAVANVGDDMRALERVLVGDRTQRPSDRPTATRRDGLVRDRSETTAADRGRLAIRDELERGAENLWRRGAAEVVSVSLSCGESEQGSRYTITGRILDLDAFSSSDFSEPDDNYLRSASATVTSPDELVRATKRVLLELRGQPHLSLATPQVATRVHHSVRLPVVVSLGPGASRTRGDVAQRVDVRAFELKPDEAHRACPTLTQRGRIRAANRTRGAKELATGTPASVGDATAVTEEHAFGFQVWPRRASTILVEARLYSEPVQKKRATDPQNGRIWRRMESGAIHSLGNPAEAPSVIDTEYACVSVVGDFRGTGWVEATGGRFVTLGRTAREARGYVHDEDDAAGAARDNRGLRRESRFVRLRAGFDLQVPTRFPLTVLLGGALGYNDVSVGIRRVPSLQDVIDPAARDLGLSGVLRTTRRSFVVGPHLGVSTHGCRLGASKCRRVFRNLYWRADLSAELDLGFIDLTGVPVEYTEFRAGESNARIFDVDANIGISGAVGFRFSPRLWLAPLLSTTFTGLDDLHGTAESRASYSAGFAWGGGLRFGGHL